MREPQALHVVALLFVHLERLQPAVDHRRLGRPQTRVLTYVQLFVLVLVIWDSVRTEVAVRQVLLADLLGCYTAALILVVGYLVSGTAAEVHGRVTVAGFNPNDAGVILALGLPVACFLLATWGGPGRRAVVLLGSTYLPLALFAVLGTGSRAALVAVVPALWYAGRLLGRSRPALAVVTFVGLGCLAVAAIPVLPAAAVQRIFDTGHELMQGNLNERQDVWAEAVRIIGEHPVSGIGAGAFRTAATGVNKVGHNFVLALLAEIGVVGLVLFLAIIVVGVRSLRTAPWALRELWLTVLVAWTFAALLHNWEYRKLTWVMFGLIAVCGALQGVPALAQVQEAQRRPSRWIGAGPSSGPDAACCSQEAETHDQVDQTALHGGGTPRSTRPGDPRKRGGGGAGRGVPRHAVPADPPRPHGRHGAVRRVERVGARPRGLGVRRQGRLALAGRRQRPQAVRDQPVHRRAQADDRRPGLPPGASCRRHRNRRGTGATATWSRSPTTGSTTPCTPSRDPAARRTTSRPSSG